MRDNFKILARPVGKLRLFREGDINPCGEILGIFSLRAGGGAGIPLVEWKTVVGNVIKGFGGVVLYSVLRMGAVRCIPPQPPCRVM